MRKRPIKVRGQTGLVNNIPARTASGMHSSVFLAGIFGAVVPSFSGFQMHLCIVIEGLVRLLDNIGCIRIALFLERDSG